MKRDKGFHFDISLTVLNQLGRNLYHNFITILGEAISNSWDADANNVWIDIDPYNSYFTISDDGFGMSPTNFQKCFLNIGFSKRVDGNLSKKFNRPYIGAKGIGKLALLSCAENITVITKSVNSSITGGTISNPELDNAIKNNITPDRYILNSLDIDSIDENLLPQKHGTTIIFDKLNPRVAKNLKGLRKLIALSFRFSLIDKNFNIFVNGRIISVEDLYTLASDTEFCWRINNFNDDYIESFSDDVLLENINLRSEVKGFVASVSKPRQLKIRSTDEVVSVDLFVNGRLREKNFFRHIQTGRVVEDYLYGQIHYDIIDKPGTDNFTSDREGILDSSEEFIDLLDQSRRILKIILDDWDKFRIAQRKDGDFENVKNAKKIERYSRGVYDETRKDYKPSEDNPNHDKINIWLDKLELDAEYNIPSYVKCFISENLIRLYLIDKEIVPSNWSLSQVEKYRSSEKKSKRRGNIKYEIRQNQDEFYYMGMPELADCEKLSKGTAKGENLERHSNKYTPIRNSICHTGLLENEAKEELSNTFEKIKKYLNKMLAK